ncbi:MAG: YihY/virulence factor BrkB family protein [Flavobacterium sp.]|nr:YihY/virulence factor BrkB family protein [Flavobacterium sp.]
MTKTILNKLKVLPLISHTIDLLKWIKLPLLSGLSLYDLLKLFGSEIIEGDLAYRSSAISFSFFMALFPFALFILNLIPYIPIDGFQQDFLRFVAQGVPPKTYDAVALIIADILINSHSGLLSSGFILSIFLSANGINAVLSGFESSKNITIKRAYFRQYLVSLAMSLLLSLLLLVTVAMIVFFEVLIQKTIIQDVFSDRISLIQLGRYAFVILMILMSTSFLFKFGIKRDKNRDFITVGSVFTTILIIITSYGFGIWVVKFSKYNELYGSIGTLLIMMFYIWINCMILLLGFELNAVINKHNNVRIQ